jgi:acetyl-CoA carboxylase biotin carboxyl carrier protein
MGVSSTTRESMTAESSGDVFDVKQIRRLIELMKKHDLTEIDLKQADQRVRIKRGGDEEPRVSAAPQLRAAEPPSTPALEPKADDSKHAVITSPMVGTFYRASSPEAAPFIKVGDRIGPESTVCIIEAMKVFNEIPAGVSGQVVAILVENGAPIEFGQPLVKVDPGA